MHVARKHALAKPARSLIQWTRYQSQISASSDNGPNLRSARGREVIFSGIQPTGIPHLGNYLGALRQWKDLQDEPGRRKNRCFFSIVDLHALTLRQEPPTLLRCRHETLAALVAIGLSPEKSVIFFQSEIPHHAELMWILSTIASTGYLNRMTQWKTKLELGENASFDDEAVRAKLKLGLFSYPVLQAADVLLYRTTLVPVGEDQAQHIEFARRLAASFNHLYGNGIDILRIPTARISPAKRIMSLKSPTLKMSKSDPNPASRILITNTPDEIRARIRAALTDSETAITYDPERRPGVSNLLDILKHASRSDASCEQHATDLQSLSMKAFKEHVADTVVHCLHGVRERFDALTQTKAGAEELDHVKRQGYLKAMAKASAVMWDVKVAVGLEHGRGARAAEADDEDTRENGPHDSTNVHLDQVGSRQGILGQAIDKQAST